MTKSRNARLAQSRGEGVGFLDADDVWLPYALERQLGWLDAYPSAEMVVGATTLWKSWSVGGAAAYNEAPLRSALVLPRALARERLHQLTNPPSVNAVLARRWAVEQVVGFEVGSARDHPDM